LQKQEFPRYLNFFSQIITFKVFVLNLNILLKIFVPNFAFKSLVFIDLENVAFRQGAVFSTLASGKVIRISFPIHFRHNCVVLQSKYRA